MDFRLGLFPDEGAGIGSASSQHSALMTLGPVLQWPDTLAVVYLGAGLMKVGRWALAALLITAPVGGVGALMSHRWYRGVPCAL